MQRVMEISHKKTEANLKWFLWPNLENLSIKINKVTDYITHWIKQESMNQY